MQSGGSLSCKVQPSDLTASNSAVQALCNLCLSKQCLHDESAMCCAIGNVSKRNPEVSTTFLHGWKTWEIVTQNGKISLC